MLTFNCKQEKPVTETVPQSSALQPWPGEMTVMADNWPLPETSPGAAVLEIVQ